MEKKRLGRSEIRVAPLCFGGNVFGWSVDERISFKILDGFVSYGFDFIDTADVYSAWAPGNRGGESETIIGKWMKLRKNREKVIVATKCGMELSPDKKGLSKSYILRAVEDSLRRLQTDYIDLYQSHTDDRSVPLDETLEAFTLLVKQGKARTIGASNYSGERFAEALLTSERLGLSRYETLQPLYNLYDRRTFEETLEPVCVKNDVGVITYYSLASGFLSGKYRSSGDTSKSFVRGSRVEKYLNEKGWRILGALDKVAEKLNSNPTRVALAWLIARPSVTGPIVSATNLDQLSDLAESTMLKLDDGSIELLNKASS